MDPVALITNVLKMVKRFVDLKETVNENLEICEELISDIAVLESPLLELKKANSGDLDCKADVIERLNQTVRDAYQFLRPIVDKKHRGNIMQYYEALKDKDGVATKVALLSGRLRSLMPTLLLAVSIDNNRHIISMMDSMKQMLQDQHNAHSRSGFGEFYAPDPKPRDDDDDRHILSIGL